MLPPDLLAWLASIPPADRDAAVEEALGIAEVTDSSPPGEHLIGYHASGLAAIVRALIETPVTAEDVVFDVGAGLGKVLLLARHLTGATARGIELQPALVDRARGAAARLGIDVTVDVGDARAIDFDATVFFLYLPFTGPALEAVLTGLRRVAERQAIVVCTLGLDLEAHAPWLVRRPLDAFWLAIYDSAILGVPPRVARKPVLTSEAAMRVAFERSTDC